VTGGNLDQDDPDAAGIFGPHSGQAPGLGGWLSEGRDCGRGQPGVLGVDIPHLDPDHHYRAAGGVPGDLERPGGRKNTTPRTPDI
jgi:hypothetical protein